MVPSRGKNFGIGVSLAVVLFEIPIMRSSSD